MFLMDLTFEGNYCCTNFKENTKIRLRFAYQVGPIPENDQRVSNVGSEDAPASDEIPLKNGIYRGDTTEIDDPNGGTTKVASLNYLCANTLELTKSINLFS